MPAASAARKTAGQTYALIALYLVILAAALLLSADRGAACAAGALACVLCALLCARQLGGHVRRCRGCALTTGELVGLLCLLI